MRNIFIRGIGSDSFFLQEVVARIYRRRTAALGDEEELPLDVGGGQYAMLVEERGVEKAALHGKADDALHVGCLLLVKAVGKVVVEEAAGGHVIPLAGVDAAKGLQQHGQRGIALTFQDAAHQAVVDEVCVHGEVVEPPFLDSGHGNQGLGKSDDFKLWNLSRRNSSSRRLLHFLTALSRTVCRACRMSAMRTSGSSIRVITG